MNTIISGIADVATSIGVFVAIWQLYLSRKTALASYEREKKQATIDAFQKYEDKFHSFDKELFNKFQYDEIPCEKIINDKENENLVRTYLNELTLLSTGVNMGIYDIHTFGRLFGDVTIRLYKQFLPYIRYRREQRKSDFVFAEFEMLAKNMMKIKKEKKGLIDAKANIAHKISDDI